MMSVQIDPGTAFNPGAPQGLFDLEPFAGSPPDYDVAPDGKRFLMIKESESDENASIELILVQNWFEELKRLVPTVPANRKNNSS